MFGKVINHFLQQRELANRWSVKKTLVVRRKKIKIITSSQIKGPESVRIQQLLGYI